jgi:competence protein ComFC
MQWNSLKRALVGLFFPLRCTGCGRDEASLMEDALCSHCFVKLPVFSTGRGGMVPLPIQKPYFGRVFSPYHYEEPIKKLILKYKYGEEEKLYRLFGKLLKHYCRDHIDLGQYQWMTYVPLSKFRKIRRGFNQSERLAHSVAESTPPLRVKNLLRRTRHARPQERLKRAERLKNTEGAFALREPKIEIKNKTVLLIDDVLTTGGTANECARVLRRAGAARVDVLVLARSTGRRKTLYNKASQ